MIDRYYPWLKTAEELGDCIQIRIGIKREGDPEWSLYTHLETDGLGAFRREVEKRGGELRRMPVYAHEPKKASMPAWVEILASSLAQTSPPEFRFKKEPRTDIAIGESTFAWASFDANTTAAITRYARSLDVSTNSVLLWALDKALRPFMSDPTQPQPWMIPVNVRNADTRDELEGNYVSAIFTKTHPDYRVGKIHKQIYQALNKGQQWVNYSMYGLGGMLSQSQLHSLVDSNKAMAQWNIGSFSNLGEHEVIGMDDVQWLFAPPTLRCQHIGAGAITVNGRLGLVIQMHPEFCSDADAVDQVMIKWAKQIQACL